MCLGIVHYAMYLRAIDSQSCILACINTMQYLQPVVEYLQPSVGCVHLCWYHKNAMVSIQ